VGTAEEGEPSFILPQPNSESFVQDLDQTPFFSETDGQGSTRVSVEEMSPGDINLPASSENIFQSFLDPSIMNDIWRMPPVVRNPYSLYKVSRSS
jgi:hypothetical protein